LIFFFTWTSLLFAHQATGQTPVFEEKLSIMCLGETGTGHPRRWATSSSRSSKTSPAKSLPLPGGANPRTSVPIWRSTPWACPDFLDRLVGEGITFLAQERKVVLCWGSVTDG